MDGSSFLIIRGVIGICIGVLAMAWPGITLNILLGIFVLYAILDGIWNLVYGLMSEEHSWETAAQGAVGIFAGIVTVFWPGVTLLLLVLFIGFWAAATGLFQVLGSVRMRDEINEAWQVTLVGVLTVLFGVMIIVFPLRGAIAMAWVLGLYAAASGVALVALGLRLRSIVRT
jgi:uncharacterized membrane protein HdeD (DUF308 family)